MDQGSIKFAVNSADGTHAQGSFDLDAAARTDASGTSPLHDEICSLEEDGLVCDVKRGNFGA